MLIHFFCVVKNYSTCGPLMDKVTTPKLHQQYAQVMEGMYNNLPPVFAQNSLGSFVDMRRFSEAEKGYNLARDYDAVIRLNLEHLNNPEKSFELARSTRSANGA